PTRCTNSTTVTRNVRHLMAFARWSQTPVLSCVDSHRPNDIGGDFVSKVGCGCPRDRMAPGTVLPRNQVIESDNCLSISLSVLLQTQQAIFTKVHKDPFTNPKFERLLTEMPARRFVIFGIPLESSLRLLALGLLMRGRRTLLIEDACGFFNEAEAGMAMSQLGVKGAETLAADSYVRDAIMHLSQRRGRRRRRNVA
ncbi:MAG: isochorismatase family protein, partial [Planctomycetes bacterium]|nr:isochorismatase family protein [Planctomycetota bacterium]